MEDGVVVRMAEVDDIVDRETDGDGKRESASAMEAPVAAKA